MNYMEQSFVHKRMKKRLVWNKIWKSIFFAAVLVALLALVVLLARIIIQGTGYLNWDFLTNFASRIPSNAGIKAALVGSLYLMLVIAPVSILLGVSTAII